MKKALTVVIAVLVIASSAGIFAIAANTETADNDKQRKEPFFISLDNEEKAELQTVITEKLEEILDEKLKDGEISEEEYTKAKESVENRSFNGAFGNRFVEKDRGFKGKFNADREEKKLPEADTEKKKERVLALIDEKLNAGEISEQEYNSYKESVENGEYSFVREFFANDTEERKMPKGGKMREKVRPNQKKPADL